MKDDSEKPPAGPAPAASTPPPPPTNVPKPGVAQNTTQPPMSPEVQQILIEANRQKYLDEGNSLAKILPSTGLREKNQPAR
jgi:hypothetical protein